MTTTRIYHNMIVDFQSSIIQYVHIQPKIRVGINLDQRIGTEYPMDIQWMTRLAQITLTQFPERSAQEKERDWPQNHHYFICE